MSKNFIMGISCLAIISGTIISCGEPKAGQLVETSATEEVVSADATEAAAVQDVATPNTMFKEEKDRVTEHHGTMQVESKDVTDYCKKLNTTIASFQGHSTELRIEEKEDVVKELPYSEDSICKVIRTHQEATFSFKVPKQQAPSLLNALLQLDGKILKLNLLEEDNTLAYREAQIIDEGAIKSKEVADTLGIERAASNRAAKEEMKYRSQFLWCNVQVQSPEQVQQIVVANPQATTASFGTALAKNLRIGNSFMRELVLICFAIWPLLLAGGVIWFFARRYVKRAD